VVECYSEWAGPCKAVVSTLKSLYFAFNDRPIKFYTVSMWLNSKRIGLSYHARYKPGEQSNRTSTHSNA
jgi:hypothetical protein